MIRPILNLRMDGASTMPSGATFTPAAGSTLDFSAATVTLPASTLAGLKFKASVRVATTANITIATALNNGDTLDGIALATNDRVLVKNQSTASQNGIYVVGVSPGRATDFDLWTEIPGAMVAVEEGTANADTIWLCSADQGGTIDSTSITFTGVMGASLTADQTFSGVNAFTGTTNFVGGVVNLTGTLSLDGPSTLNVSGTFNVNNGMALAGAISGAGTWAAGLVAGAYGGTGVANTGKTITIGGNLTTAGAFTITLTATGNTALTIPTTGTLATLAGSEALTGKTYNGLIITTTGGATLTVSSGKAFSVSNTLTLAGTDGSTLNISTGGTLGTAAFTASTAYATAASITGGGVLATGGFTLTVPATGTALISGGALGTPTSGALTNCTGLPLTTGVTGTLPVANGGNRRTTVVKTSDESRTSSATLTNDSALSIAIVSGKTYIFEIEANFTAVSTTPDYGIAVNGPTNSLFFYSLLVANGANFKAFSGATTYGTAGGVYYFYDELALTVRIRGVVTATASGNLAFAWRQSTSSADATVSKAGGSMWVEEVP